MGTINSALSVATGALDADQAALSIVANNVANANTPGYTEETPNWQQNAPISIDGVSVGDGVSETGATSQRDRVLEARLDQQQQLASASGARLTALDNIQALFPPDSGSSTATAGDIGSDLTSFFDSFSSLESDPTDNALREQVLSSASTLAGDISNAASSLNQQSAALDQEANGVASQVNSLTGAIAQLNLQIQSTSPDADAGMLEDQRQQDLSQLSQLIGINQVTTENNGLSITTTSGQLLVSEGQSFQLTTGTVNAVTDFFLGGTDITAQLQSGGGQLAGYLTARDVDIPGALSSLDQLAYDISTSVNAQNNAGIDAEGDTGAQVAGSTTGAWTLDIFSPPPTYAANQASSGTDDAGAAAAMSVVMTDPNQIAAAGAGDGTGNNSNAVAMAKLGTESLGTPTTSFSLTQNLDSNGAAATGTVQFFDSLGNGYQATVTYTNEGDNTWGYSVALPASAFASGVSTPVTGTMTFDAAAGNLIQIEPAGAASPETVGTSAGSVSSIPLSFTGLADGAADLNIGWNLLAANGTSLINQSAAASAQSAQSQNGFAGSQTPSDYYSNFVSTLGSTVAEVQTENTAQTASVTQLQTQNNSLSSVNLNDEAAAMSTLESSYQAASQVFTLLNTIMASALNLGEETTVT
jgi:flagellar hook-associated protein 1